MEVNLEMFFGNGQIMAEGAKNTVSLSKALGTAWRFVIGQSLTIFLVLWQFDQLLVSALHLKNLGGIFC